MLDTTPDNSFSGVTGAGRIMQNHGIHGCRICAAFCTETVFPTKFLRGHYEKSDVLEQVARAARGTMMAAEMRKSRVGRVGEPFCRDGRFPSAG